MTTSGKKVLGTIRGQIGALETQSAALSRDLRVHEQTIDGLMQEREKVYDTLTHLYLPELDADDITRTLHERQQVIHGIFQQQQERRRQVESLMADSRQQRLQIEGALDSLLSAAEAKDVEIAEAREKTAETLTTRGDYQTICLGPYL